MSSYPAIFNVKCLSDKKINCPSTSLKKYCDLDNFTNEITNSDHGSESNQDSNQIIDQNYKLNLAKTNINRVDEDDLNEFHPYNPALTYKSCKKGDYKTPIEILNNNHVLEEPKSSHSWSNQRGYGHITIGNFDTCSNIHSKVHPYNRIEPLPLPHKGIVDTMYSPWNTNKIDIKRN